MNSWLGLQLHAFCKVRAYTKTTRAAARSNSCLDRLNHGFCGNPEMLEEFLRGGRGAEAAQADEGAAGLDPALPAEGRGRLDADVQRARAEHLVAVMRRLLLE